MLAEAPSVDSVQMVCEYPDVFFTNFSSISLESDVDISIDVEQGTKPICVPLYRIAPTKLKELSVQLQVLLD